ncbi:MAG: hypothetical protein IBV53_00110 [Candidatus Atribacteria bacterium]
MKRKNNSIIKAVDVANWMLSQITKKRELYQNEVVYLIEDKFGPKFVYENRLGNAAINREVLKEFRKLTEETVVWSRNERCWRIRSTDDPKDGRLVE